MGWNGEPPWVPADDRANKLLSAAFHAFPRDYISIKEETCLTGCPATSHSLTPFQGWVLCPTSEGWVVNKVSKPVFVPAECVCKWEKLSGQIPFSFAHSMTTSEVLHWNDKSSESENIGRTDKIIVFSRWH